MFTNGPTAIQRIVIVGGGTAGWLAACRIAAAARADAAAPVSVTLVESPEVATVGVGEGTWPTMRGTLSRIGLDEAEFMAACDASFKHGSRFVGWADGGPGDGYLHPFTPPLDAEPAALVAAWRAQAPGEPFADAVSAQGRAARAGLAPRQAGMPPYAGALNYGYHLDATKLAELLRRHATGRLGVRHRRDHVTGVERAGDAVLAVHTRAHGRIAGDLFLDCTGHAALLLGGEAWVDAGDVLFNDRALAVQVPVAPASPVAAQTDATAHAAGWLWDIGLPTRRGVGCVYSSRHTSDDEAAATLAAYLGVVADGIGPRRLAFRPGHRERFWVGNCLAVGLSAGFLEPLEASAIVTVELSLDALLADWPTPATLGLVAERFNALFRYRWGRIVEFLKLHYLVSRRPEPYWRDHRDPASVPPRLAGLLELWRHRPPTRADLPMADEVFPAASYQYVLYGMGWAPPPAGPLAGEAPPSLAPVAQRARALAASLPPLRAYLDAAAAAAAPRLVRR